mmetsp:Transcript_37481/g.71791  ORF Transcript_37481/g.71791 Transcript_37481/m.71791 type:complete len:289 (+) Transcript_37481:578-1444(+)
MTRHELHIRHSLGVAAEDAYRLRRLPQIVRVHVVVGGAHCQVVLRHGVVLDAAHVGLEIDVQHALLLPRVPHLHFAVVAAAHQHTGVGVAVVHAPDALLMLLQLHQALARGRVPQRDHSLVVARGDVRLDEFVPGQAAQLGPRHQLHLRLVRVDPVLEQGVEVKDADSLGDPGGDEQLLVAIKLDAADHAVAGVVGAVRRDGRQLAELTVLGVHREDPAEGVEPGPGAFRGIGRDEIFESLSLLPSGFIFHLRPYRKVALLQIVQLQNRPLLLPLDHALELILLRQPR